MSNSNNEFVLELMALLDEQRSRVEINRNIKELQKTVNKIKLTATLQKETPNQNSTR